MVDFTVQFLMVVISDLRVHLTMFVDTCLAVGIALSLATICGYTVANCFSNNILCIYIAFMWCFLFLEVVVIVNIYFRMDWLAKINKYIGENQSEFKSFILFHLMMSRIILILSLVPQVSAVAVANILRVVGIERMSRYHLDVANFHQSFLVVPDSCEPENS
ncbi:uncharacterized protein LOC133283658 [Gastrolobium bilobum]|uniref:uncharacterized protein LOC133283658 n=1 Tax=Gastrolobium bilobum TaxID=150636 RepID=UPI002AAF828E|nr:uncharacterized protein LOC133283658 [Gastrolobium bilobum]